MIKTLSQLLLMALVPTVMIGANDAAARLGAAADVFTEIMSAPDKGIPQDLLDKSECIVIVPDLKKAAFVFGAKYGKGFISCRNAGRPGWSAPAAVRVEGGSFGLQIGGAAVDYVMLVMNERGADRLLGSRFTLGGNASVAAGPVGRDTTAQTDARMTAEILTWSRQRGAFAGVSLTGATLREDQEWNKEMYGREMHNRDIVQAAELNVPAAAERLRAALNKYSSRSGR
jgi:lipid-binding SYLF domain-containing protein